MRITRLLQYGIFYDHTVMMAAMMAGNDGNDDPQFNIQGWPLLQYILLHHLIFWPEGRVPPTSHPPLLAAL